MTTARSAAINGAELKDVDSRVYVLGTSCDAPKETQQGAAFGGRSGQRVTVNRREYLDIKVTFGIDIRKEHLNERSEVFELCMAWAALAREGAWITIGSKKDRQIWARTYQLPAEGDQWQWASQYTIVFRAWEAPWWQATEPITIRRSGVSSLQQQISVTGNRRTVLDFEFTNTSGSTINALSISTGSATMAFTGLGLADRSTLAITHREDGLLQIRINGVSALAFRTPESDNDLWIDPGVPTVHITAGGAGTIQMGSYGRFE